MSPIKLKMAPMAKPPTKKEDITFQLPIPVQINKTAPIKMANADVSPTDPGIRPKNELVKLNIPSAANMSITPATAGSVGDFPTVDAR